MAWPRGSRRYLGSYPVIVDLFTAATGVSSPEDGPHRPVFLKVTLPGLWRSLPDDAIILVVVIPVLNVK